MLMRSFGLLSCLVVVGGDPCSNKGYWCARTAEAPGNAQAETGASSPEKAAGLITQMKCIYTCARSVGNKQEELEPIVQQENYDVGGWK